METLNSKSPLPLLLSLSSLLHLSCYFGENVGKEYNMSLKAECSKGDQQYRCSSPKKGTSFIFNKFQLFYYYLLKVLLIPASLFYLYLHELR
ncbi:hypothetical protein KFK09_026443 [Dendrobium nobile]|uniref:Uncharacterized protein n=1 Tax=Dendrobium nobile TaxID=94219 RepID=A0A8T3A6U2_DENNO|nr:hypothetical protein KFK09_026443 [Dendrobium nobile]